MSVKPSPNKLIDVVILVSSASLDFLNGWRAFLSPYHLIIVQTSGGPKMTAQGFDAEIHLVAEVQKMLGQDFWCLAAGDGLSRSLGYLLSKKKYIFSLGECKINRSEDLTSSSVLFGFPLHADESCLVAKDPSGKEIDALQQHLVNLTSPATPYFFNTLYDPYRSGADFVRGYPFSLREGTGTAVSHGLWLNRPGVCV